MNNKIKNLVREINKKIGLSAIKFASEVGEKEKQPTGVKEIDKILGGGFPYGQFSVVWGEPASGKTTLMYSTIAEAQKQGKICYYIAMEASFDLERAKSFGVNTEELIIGQFPTAEKALDTIIKLSEEKVVDVIILDSIHGLAPKMEVEDKKGEKSLEDDTMALLARKLSQFFRRAVHPVSNGNVCVILIGQTRTSVGFIALEQLTGGWALKHYSSLILHMRRGQKSDAPTASIKTEEGKTKRQIIGFDCKLKIDKTQVSGTFPELTEIHIPFYYEKGFGEALRKRGRKKKGEA